MALGIGAIVSCNTAKDAPIAIIHKPPTTIIHESSEPAHQSKNPNTTIEIVKDTIAKIISFPPFPLALNNLIIIVESEERITVHKPHPQEQLARISRIQFKQFHPSFGVQNSPCGMPNLMRGTNFP
jgi:hypothetical protein